MTAKQDVCFPEVLENQVFSMKSLYLKSLPIKLTFLKKILKCSIQVEQNIHLWCHQFVSMLSSVY